MKINQIGALRLVSQQIIATGLRNPLEMVAWMGAIQAQDYSMSKWAIGSRLPGSIIADVELALDRAEIIRTHVLRPTWHLVPARDIYWMLELTAGRIRASLKSRHKQLELTKDVFSKGFRLIEKALRDERHLTRAELLNLISGAGIDINTERGSHLLMMAELEGLICSGRKKVNQSTYALLEERVPHKKILNKDEALACLAGRYFKSHGPATISDFAWWSGLTVKEARLGLESVKTKFSGEKINGQLLWYAKDLVMPARKTSLFLLPAFDEFIISYKDRSAAITLEDNKRAVSNNGIFRPLIVKNGQVQGTWKRTIGKDEILMEAQLFTDKLMNEAGKEEITQAASLYGRFMNKGLKVNFAASHERKN